MLSRAFATDSSLEQSEAASCRTPNLPPQPSCVGPPGSGRRGRASSAPPRKPEHLPPPSCFLPPSVWPTFQVASEARQSAGAPESAQRSRGVCKALVCYELRRADAGFNVKVTESPHPTLRKLCLLACFLTCAEAD